MSLRSGFYEGKTVLVTGAASGIGREFCRLLAPVAGNIVAVDRDEKGLRDIARELEGAKARFLTLVRDLADPRAAEEVAAETESSGLTVDVLINGAGFGYLGEFHSADPRVYRDMIQLHTVTPTYLAARFLPGMLAKGSGGILNVASTAAFQPLARFSVYAGTKSYLLNFTESLWGEYAHRGVRVSVLCPGNTATRFHEKANIGRRFVFNLMQPAEVAERGLDGLARGRLTVIPHFGDWLLTALARLCPRQIMAAITRRHYSES